MLAISSSSGGGLLKINLAADALSRNPNACFREAALLLLMAITRRKAGRPLTPPKRFQDHAPPSSNKFSDDVPEGPGLP